jgi:universal stress protein E
MNDLKNILVAVDFSRHSRVALMQASRIALLKSARLHVLHVVDSMAVATLADMRRISYENQAALSEEGARTALAAWMHQAGAPQHSMMITTVEVPVQGILSESEKIQPELLIAVIAGAGEAPQGSGTIAAKLARRARTVVLLLRDSHQDKFKHIVACVDFSDVSTRVVEEAARFARLDGAEIELLHAWREPWVVCPSSDVTEYPTIVFTEGERRMHLENLRLRLHEFVGPLTQGIETREVLCEVLNYGSGIVDHVREGRADLIVIGNNREENIRHFLLGSTAEKLLHIVSCSLLIVKKPSKQESLIEFFNS